MIGRFTNLFLFSYCHCWFLQEQLQKEAFEALQLQKDTKHQRISSQIALIEDELAQLTVVEIERREFRQEEELVRQIPGPSLWVGVGVWVGWEWDMQILLIENERALVTGVELERREFRWKIGEAVTWTRGGVG